MSGHIDIDLDGTLAEYHGWNGGKIGKPVERMAKRVRGWIAQGVPIHILTARAASNNKDRDEQIAKVRAWFRENFGKDVVVTAEKDFETMEIWDDRAVQVEKNTGRRIDGLN